MVCYSLWYNAPTMLPATGRLTGIINKPLLLHLVGCLYYLYFIIFLRMERTLKDHQIFVIWVVL